jgi:hypothetical protein
LPMTFFRNRLAKTPIFSSIDDLDISQPALSAPFTRPGRRACHKQAPTPHGATPATQLATSASLFTRFPTATLVLCRGNTFIPTLAWSVASPSVATAMFLRWLTKGRHVLCSSSQRQNVYT